MTTLHDLRRQHSLRLSALAAATGISARRLAAYEYHNGALSSRELQLLAAFFDRDGRVPDHGCVAPAAASRRVPRAASLAALAAAATLAWYAQVSVDHAPIGSAAIGTPIDHPIGLATAIAPATAPASALQPTAPATPPAPPSTRPQPSLAQHTAIDQPSSAHATLTTAVPAADPIAITGTPAPTDAPPLAMMLPDMLALAQQATAEPARSVALLQAQPLADQPPLDQIGRAARAPTTPAEPLASVAQPDRCPLAPDQGAIAVTQHWGTGTHAPAAVWGGVDLIVRDGATAGTPIVTTHAGRAQVVLNSYPGGNYVAITSATGWRTAYAHLDQVFVADDVEIAAGTVIGTAGQTGYATGPHLHYETWRDGVNVDPLPFLFCQGI